MFRSVISGTVEVWPSRCSSRMGGTPLLSMVRHTHTSVSLASTASLAEALLHSAAARRACAKATHEQSSEYTEEGGIAATREKLEFPLVIDFFGFRRAIINNHNHRQTTMSITRVDKRPVPSLVG